MPLSTDQTEITIEETLSRPAGGTMPRSEFPSIALKLVLKNQSVPKLAKKLHLGTPAIGGYTTDAALFLDLRASSLAHASSLIPPSLLSLPLPKRSRLRIHRNPSLKQEESIPRQAFFLPRIVVIPSNDLIGVLSWLLRNFYLLIEPPC